MAFIVVYDANVLYPNTLRDLLIRISQAGLVQVGIDGQTVAACVQQIADSRTRPPQDTEDVLSQLERDGLVESISALRTG
jgi:hypothetical protein